MRKLYTIKQNKNKKTKAKYPYRIYLNNGRIIPVPSQHKFKNTFIQKHGCSLVAFYMALRFLGVKKSMAWCKKYLNKNFKLNGHAKYSLAQVAKAINKTVSGSPAAYHRPASAETVRNALKNGKMVLFEETNPVHSVVLLYDGVKIKRFSDGSYKNITVNNEVKKRCGDNYYGGCVIIKRK